jgi:hypothetical protein
MTETEFEINVKLMGFAGLSAWCFHMISMMETRKERDRPTKQIYLI